MKACVRKERALKSQVCGSNGQECYLAQDGWVFIAHTQKNSHWEDSAHFTIKPQFNLRLDCHSCNDYFQIWNPIVGGAGGLTGLGGSETVGYTEVDSLTPLCGNQTTKVVVVGGQTTRGSLGPLYF
jgi:hypothetical protein